MAHPFFNAIKYPWHRPEAVALQNVLTQLIPNQALIQNIYDQCAPNLPALNQNQAPRLVWAEALQNLTAASALRTLLDLIKQQNPNSANTQQVIRQVIDAESGMEKKIFSASLLVLDREDLRITLSEIEPDENPTKVLLVRGASKTGKSHGRHLFEQFARDQGSAALYLYPEILPTVKHLIQQLFGALEASDEIPPGFSTDIAYYQEACLKLMEVANKKEKRLWIAVDDLAGKDGAPLMDENINKFCDQFALNMLNPMFRNRFRLMLIHYPEEIPSKWRSDFWAEDRTSDADIKKEHVEQLLKAWGLAKDRVFIGDELPNLATDILKKAEAPPPAGQKQKPRLQRIDEELKAAIRDLQKKPS